MGNKKTEQLDFLFISGPFGLNLTGGDKILVNLAERLQRDRYSVGILFVPQVEEYLEENDLRMYKMHLNSAPITIKLFRLIFHTKFGFWTLQILKKLKGNSRNNLSRRDFKIYFQNLPSHITSKVTVAVGWRSVIAMHRISFQTRSESNRYYFIQHDEDDLSYSGNLSSLVERTYRFHYRKIVYNEHLQNRFSDERPIRLNMGLLWKPKDGVPPEKKVGNHVLLVLRSGNSKGAEYAIEAANIVSSTLQAQFRSFGDYNRNIPSFIRHYGWVNERMLSDLYNWASIFVLPSIIEGYSLTAAEAGSAGCAIIASDCVGVREFIKDSINGFLVPTKSPEAIASRIIELIEDSQKRINFAVNIKNELRNKNFDNTYKEFIDAILRESKSKRW